MPIHNYRNYQFSNLYKKNSYFVKIWRILHGLLTSAYKIQHTKDDIKVKRML